MAEERTQRRLTNILAADVVGYSRLMECDEAGTLAALKARRCDVLTPLVAKHQGRIFKTTGDGVLVEFASTPSTPFSAPSNCSKGWRLPMPVNPTTASSCCASASTWAM